jgi:hypothetical protein
MLAFAEVKLPRPRSTLAVLDVLSRVSLRVFARSGLLATLLRGLVARSSVEAMRTA